MAEFNNVTAGEDISRVLTDSRRINEVNKLLNSRSVGKLGSPPVGAPNDVQPGVVRVKNWTGQARERGDALGIKDVVFTPAENTAGFIAGPTYQAELWTKGTRPVILTAPIDAGGIGYAIITGHAVARVFVANTDDEYCRITNNATNFLYSYKTTPADRAASIKLVYAPAAGHQLCTVFLGEAKDNRPTLYGVIDTAAKVNVGATGQTLSEADFGLAEAYILGGTSGGWTGVTNGTTGVVTVNLSSGDGYAVPAGEKARLTYAGDFKKPNGDILPLYVAEHIKNPWAVASVTAVSALGPGGVGDFLVEDYQDGYAEKLSATTDVNNPLGIKARNISTTVTIGGGDKMFAFLFPDEGHVGANNPNWEVSPGGSVTGGGGEVGPAGADGADGTDGTNGTNGTDGTDGNTGPQGGIGPQGNDGADGEQGTPGVNSWLQIATVTTTQAYTTANATVAVNGPNIASVINTDARFSGPDGNKIQVGRDTENGPWYIIGQNNYALIFTGKPGAKPNEEIKTRWPDSYTYKPDKIFGDPFYGLPLVGDVGDITVTNAQMIFRGLNGKHYQQSPRSSLFYGKTTSVVSAATDNGIPRTPGSGTAKIFIFKAGKYQTGGGTSAVKSILTRSLPNNTFFACDKNEDGVYTILVADETAEGVRQGLVTIEIPGAAEAGGQITTPTGKVQLYKEGAAGVWTADGTPVDCFTWGKGPSVVGKRVLLRAMPTGRYQLINEGCG